MWRGAPGIIPRRLIRLTCPIRMSVSSQPPTPGLSLNRSQSILIVWNSDIPRLRNNAKRLNLTPFLFFTLNLRGRLQGIGNGFGACIFFSVRTAENAYRPPYQQPQAKG